MESDSNFCLLLEVAEVEAIGEDGRVGTDGHESTLLFVLVGEVVQLSESPVEGVTELRIISVILVAENDEEEVF